LKWPELFAACRAGLPDVAANGEPVGPQSSVASESDPLHVLTGAAVTFTAGLPIYVWHTGPGVRGGGKSDRALKRSASLSDLPRVDEMLHGFAAMKKHLPADLPGWSRVNPTAETNPLRLQTAGALGPVDVAAARQGGRVVIVPFGVRDALSVHASDAIRVEVLHPGTGAVIADRTLAGGERFSLPRTLTALVVIGRPIRP
jgi:hypothetical protein